MEEELYLSHKTYPLSRNKYSKKISFCMLFVLHVLEICLTNNNVVFFLSFFVVSVFRYY
jgi:hypothetical protein